MTSYFKNLSDTTRGIILMFVGAVLLLHTLGFFVKLTSNLLIIFALFLMAVGFVQADLWNRIKTMQHKK